MFALGMDLLQVPKLDDTVGDTTDEHGAQTLAKKNR